MGLRIISSNYSSELQKSYRLCNVVCQRFKESGRDRLWSFVDQKMFKRKTKLYTAAAQCGIDVA